MSQSSVACDIIFLEGMKIRSTPNDIFLYHFDVINAGSLRQKKILEYAQGRHVKILIQRKDQALLKAELSWLSSFEFVVEEMSFEEEFIRQFDFHFPLSSTFLAENKTTVLCKYLLELPWSEGGLIAHMRYLPGFFKQSLKSQELAELAHWEWAHLDLSTQEYFVEVSQNEHLSVNSSLHVVALAEAASVLSRDKGLYALVFSTKNDTVVEKKLDPYEAQLIDLLSEDRPCTKSQLLALIEQFDFVPSLSREQWQKKYESLLVHDIIFE